LALNIIIFKLKKTTRKKTNKIIKKKVKNKKIFYSCGFCVVVNYVFVMPYLL
jgi:hypothetical protein